MLPFRRMLCLGILLSKENARLGLAWFISHPVLANKAKFMFSISLKPSPPYIFANKFQDFRVNLCFWSLVVPRQKFLKLVLIKDLQIDLGNRCIDILYEGIVLAIVLISMVLLTCDGNFDFWLSSFLLMFSSSSLIITVFFFYLLNDVGSLKYFILDVDDLYGIFKEITTLVAWLVLLVM